MSVYRPAGYRSYVIKVRVGDRWQRFRGTRDLRTSRGIGRHLRLLLWARAAGDALPPEVSHWLRDLNVHYPTLYRRLLTLGVLDRFEVEANRPLSEHLDGMIDALPGFDDAVRRYTRNGATTGNARNRVLASHPELYTVRVIGYVQYLLSRNDTPEHVTLTASRIRQVVGGCGFLRLKDVDAAKVSLWLDENRRIKGIGVRTSNGYLRAFKSFLTWTTERVGSSAAGNPLTSLSPINQHVDVRRRRRPPTDKELVALLSSVATGPAYRGLSGEDRQLLYCLAVTLGLRARELGSLTPQSFDMTRLMPSVTVEAAYSKHRRVDVIPLHPHLVPRLRYWLERKRCDQPLWPGSWLWSPAAMLRSDLERAGVAFEVQGRYFDFHALRHGAITRAATAMNLKELRTFARHSNINLTMRYTHTEFDELAVAVGRVPVFAAIDAVMLFAPAASAALPSPGTPRSSAVPLPLTSIERSRDTTWNSGSPATGTGTHNHSIKACSARVV